LQPEDEKVSGDPLAPAATRHAEPPSAVGPIMARGGTYYRMTRYLMALLLFGFGIASIYDGFYAWQPARWHVTHPNEKDKQPLDILLNEIMGIALPPLAILLVVRCLYNSRGKYLLVDGVVTVPGHPPVPLSAIQAVDRRRWDRKGIAYVEYDLQTGNGGKGKFRLDDFVYDREPTDAIFRVIEHSLLGSASPETGEAATE